jgi:DNA processing protein
MSMDPFDALRVSFLPKVGPHRGRRLLSRFGSFHAVARASFQDLLTVEGVDAVIAKGIAASCRDAETMRTIDRTVEANQRLMKDGGFALIPFFDPSFPPMLKRIYDAPLFLFMAGEYRSCDERAVAIVGTRTPTEYGKTAAAELVSGLVEQGITIVSGLALGIDAVAHQAALRQGARTIAVLGSGLANVYPSSHGQLAARIEGQGCVMSEFSLHAKPDAQNFPRRNRIISGLSLAVIVVESRETGGAMITAGFAFDQNKEVFAVPGSIFSQQSMGCHLLLKRGIARPITSVQDLFTELPSLAGTPERVERPPVQLTLSEQSIIDALSDQPLHIDALAASTSLPISDALVALLKLEFAGLVRQLPGKHFVVSR